MQTTQRQGGSEQLQTLMQQTQISSGPPPPQPQLHQQISGNLSFNGTLSREDEEMSKSALSTFRAKEEEIEKKKMEVKEKVQLQLGRIEEETRRLANIREVWFLYGGSLLKVLLQDDKLKGFEGRSGVLWLEAK